MSALKLSGRESITAYLVVSSLFPRTDIHKVKQSLALGKTNSKQAQISSMLYFPKLNTSVCQSLEISVSSNQNIRVVGVDL